MKVVGSLNLWKYTVATKRTVCQTEHMRGNQGSSFTTGTSQRPQWTQLVSVETGLDSSSFFLPHKTQNISSTETLHERNQGQSIPSKKRFNAAVKK